MLDRRLRMRYHNTMKDLLLLIYRQPKDRKPYTAQLDDTTIPHVQIYELSKLVPLEKQAPYLNTVNPNVPLLSIIHGNPTQIMTKYSTGYCE